MPNYKLGTTNGQQRKMDQLVAEAGVRSSTWQQDAIDNGGFSTLVRATAIGRTVRIVKRVPTYDPSTGIYRFEVDFGMGLGAMIEEGRYDYSDPDLTPERFPVEGKGLVEFEGKAFDVGAISGDSAEWAIKAFDPERPWAPSEIATTLGFGAAFPDVQRSKRIVGFGSVVRVDGKRRTPYLGTNHKGRSLDLSFATGWAGIYRLLGVRPVAQASA